MDAVAHATHEQVRVLNAIRQQLVWVIVLLSVLASAAALVGLAALFSALEL